MKVDALAIKDSEKSCSPNRIARSQQDEYLLNANELASIVDGAKHANNQAPSSFQLLRDVRTKSDDVVTKVRGTIDQRETKWMHDEEKDKENRAKIMHQLNHSPREDECAIGWQQCSESTNMQDLFDLLVKQQNVCEAFLAKLENIGKELGSELREKDHEYVTALKVNCQEVEQLQNCITEEHSILKEAFARELKLIEESLIVDRNCILSTHRSELDGLISKRKEAETARLEQQRKVIEEHRRDIKECESKGGRDREELKQKFESEVRRLELELEETQAQHQFDSDALEYNYRVLTEMSENEGSVKKQKKRIMKGKEERTRDKQEKNQAIAQSLRENKVLEADCERIEKQASGLKEKFARFKVSDDEKFEAVLAMNTTDLRKLQRELKESQDFILGGAIGCETAEQSITSDVTCDVQSKCKLGADGIGLESEYDNEFSTMFDKSDEWSQAEILMSNYKSILERREELNLELASVERQNMDMERELAEKLKDKVNTELAFPPSSLMSAVGE